MFSGKQGNVFSNFCHSFDRRNFLFLTCRFPSSKAIKIPIPPFEFFFVNPGRRKPEPMQATRKCDTCLEYK